MRWSGLPYVVEIAVPRRGLQGTVAMYDFHARKDIQAHRGRAKYKDGRRYVRWHFASLTTAHKFARQFGGSVVMRR
jgi:hypothetical protein